MRNFKLLTIWLVGGFILFGCELPKEPNFTTSHKIESPLLFNKTYQFLGDSASTPEALLDTTSTDFDSLFSITPDGDDAGLVSIIRDEEFDFGDLNDAIPEISIDPTDFSSAVGEIELGSFSSGAGDLGSASFQEITGLNPALFPSGTPLPAGNTASPINIAVGDNTDFFVSATIRSGALELTVTNNLGFNVTTVDIDLRSSNTVVGSTTINNLDHNTTGQGQIPFDEGDQLFDLNVDLDVSWIAQNTQAEPGDLLVNSIDGVNLIASEVEAAVTAIEFTTNNVTVFESTEFEFTSPAHYAELGSGSLTIDPIVNGIDLTLEELVISFPGIRSAPFAEADSLVISYTGGARILRSSTSIAQNVDLTGYRIYAANNEVNYTIRSLTENTQEAAPGDQTRVINETDEINSRVEITNLTIAEAFGEIASQTVLLGDDDAANGVDVVDLFNETEVSLTEIDDLADISEEIDGIELVGASLSINYVSNIGVPTTIYGAILGVSPREEIYLTGTSAETQVQAGDPYGSIQANGIDLNETQLIKFTIDPSPDGSNIEGSFTFDNTNSNINELLSALPTEIRFVGTAVINESGGEATIATPLEFDPSFGVELPLYFSADNAEFEPDAIEVSVFEDFPDPNDDFSIKTGQLVIDYENALPSGFIIELNFIDENGASVTTLPLMGDDPYELSAGQIDAGTRFVDAPTVDQLIISMTEAQLSELYRADSIAVTARLNTFNLEAVKFRATDSITLSVAGNFTIENTVGGDN